jgi:sugar/nucleoside kinase (ribokinase family)
MSNARNGLLAGGNWIVDAVKIIDTWPQQDALANIFSTVKGTGGSPFNLLVDLARMGVQFPLAAVGLVGDDDNGRWIVEECRRWKIDTTALQHTAEAPTSYTDVMTVRARGGGRFSTPAARMLCSMCGISTSRKRTRGFFISVTCSCSTDSTSRARATEPSPARCWRARGKRA